MKPHSPTTATLRPRPLTSPPRPYKRHRTSPHPSPETFAAFLIICLGSKVRVDEKKLPPICFPAAGLPPLPHRPLKPRVSFVSLPSPSFSICGDFSETVATGGKSSGELWPPATVRSTVDPWTGHPRAVYRPWTRSTIFFLFLFQNKSKSS
jgi:hypothetical protein